MHTRNIRRTTPQQQFVDVEKFHLEKKHKKLQVSATKATKKKFKKKKDKNGILRYQSAPQKVIKFSTILKKKTG